MHHRPIAPLMFTFLSTNLACDIRDVQPARRLAREIEGASMLV